MELQTCRECRRLFHYLTGDVICPECRKRLEEEYCEAKEYVTENTGTVMAQVAQDCDIALPHVKQWVREGRLHTSDEQKAYSRCERCGNLIPSGQFCNACKSMLLNEVGNALKSDIPAKTEEKSKTEGPKMRFLNH